MKIVIVESELYLAQSIAAKLSEYTFETEIYSSVKDALESDGDTYLLSTSIQGQSCTPLIEAFRDKVIILMVNYINNDTVGEPIRLGAHDYIVKPFMIEDLIRKIEHHRKVYLLEKTGTFYREYVHYAFESIDHGHDPSKISLPVLVQTNYQRAADKLAMEISDYQEKPLVFIPLDREGWGKRIAHLTQQEIGYIIYLERMRKSEREALWDMTRNKPCIFSAIGEIDNVPIDTITVHSRNKLYDQNDILTIDEYVKHVVKRFQYLLPDTELSRRLGISRKSLWEKRKKYDLFKQK